MFTHVAACASNWVTQFIARRTRLAALERTKAKLSSKIYRLHIYSFDWTEYKTDADRS